jgi:methylmalonyl-CoA mutase N-terminal domain/subunit
VIDPRQATLPSWNSTSGIPLKPYYSPDDLSDRAHDALSSAPGEAPYMRGPYPDMYRDRAWRIFQLSGYGDPTDMNARLKFLLKAGETGIIIKHDRMTDDHLYDVDHPEIVERREDVGLTGTVTVGLRDYETILADLPLADIYAKPGGGVVQSAPYTQSCYWSVALGRGIPLNRITGTGQSDFFLTYLGCINKEQISPRDGMRFNLDIIEWCLEHMPHWVPVSIPGYNAAESGLNSWEELGAVFANAIAYLDGMISRGFTDVSGFAHLLGGMNFRTTTDLFEDAAKFRIARRMWHRVLTERYGVTDVRATKMRIHGLTAGSYMTYQEPLNNIVRGTVMAMAAILGGAQSLGVSGYDEALSIPSDHAHLMSIRIQQILQEETNLRAVADPLGGSYYVETLGDELEDRAWGFVAEIEDRGGFIEVIDNGWLLQRAEERSQEDAWRIRSGERQIVGVNAHPVDDPLMTVDGFEAHSGAVPWERAMERLKSLRETRDERASSDALANLVRVVGDPAANIVPAVMSAVQADVSIGEIGDVYRRVLGTWDPPLTV